MSIKMTTEIAISMRVKPARRCMGEFYDGARKSQPPVGLASTGTDP